MPPVRGEPRPDVDRGVDEPLRRPWRSRSPRSEWGGVAFALTVFVASGFAADADPATLLPPAGELDPLPPPVLEVDAEVPESGPKMRSRARRYSSSRWVSVFVGVAVPLVLFGVVARPELAGRFRICIRGGGAAMDVTVGAARLLLLVRATGGLAVDHREPDLVRTTAMELGELHRLPSGQ